MSFRARALLLATAGWLTVSGSAMAAELKVWGLQSFNPKADAFIGELVTAFGKEKGIQAEYVVVPANVINERLAAAFEGGAPPDAFMSVSSQGQYYMSRGLTVPMDGVLANMRKVPGGIFENVVPQGYFDGKLHGVPLEIDVTPMYVRKDLLADVGAGVPQTWEELRETAKKIQAKNPMMQTLGLTLSNAPDAESQLRMLVWSYGGEMFAADGKTITFDSPETRKAYGFLGDMFKNDRTIPKSVLTWDDAGNNQAYQTGRAAIIINPPSTYQWARDNDPKLLANTALVNIPKGTGPKARNGASVSSWVWLVAKQSKNQDSAEAWLNYFFEPTRYAKVIESVGGRWLPIYRQMMKDLPLFRDTADFAAFPSMAESGLIDGHAGPPTVLASKIFAAKVVSNVAQKILVDGMTADEAVAWGQAEMIKISKEP